MTTITVYSLSTCGKCKSVKSWLDKQGLSFRAIEVDLLNGEKRMETLRELQKLNPLGTFPTTLVQGTVIRGNRPQKIREALPKSHKAGLWQRIRHYFKL